MSAMGFFSFLHLRVIARSVFQRRSNLLKDCFASLRSARNDTVILILICLFSLHCFSFSAAAQSSEKELFLVAQKAFDDGFYDVAIRYIEDYLEKYPQTQKRIEANLLLGQCYFFKTQYLKAFNIFQDLLKYPEFKDATLFWLGETYLKGSDYSQAEKYYRQLIELYPDSLYTPQALYSLGWTFYEQKKYDQAAAQFQQLIKQFPAHTLSEDALFKLGECSYNLKSYNDAIQYFKKYILNYPKSIRNDQVYFYIGEAYYYSEEFSVSLEYYGKAAEISHDPKLRVMVSVSRGWSALKLKDYEQARKFFDEALTLAQLKGILFDDIYLGQASLFTEMNDDGKALQAYEEIIKKFPKSSRLAEAHLGKANMLYALKDYDQAIAAYQTVLDRFSNQEESKDIVEKAHFGLAWTYLKAGNIDLSIKSFQDIMDQSQNKVVKVSALTQIADAYQDAGKPEKALEVYDQILRDYPDSLYTDYVQYRQGVALLKMEKSEDATLSFKSLKANFPQSKYLNEADYYLGVAYFKKGDWAASRDQIEAFMKDLPKTNEFSAEADYILALSIFNLGDFKKAMELFERIITNYPNQSAMMKDAQMGIAKCFYNLGEGKEAFKRFKIILYKYPKTETASDALLWLADHALEASDFTNAILYYQQFLNDFPGSEKTSLARLELGQAYQAQGAYDQALNQLKLVDDPNNKELYAKAKLLIADIFSKKLDPDNAVVTYQNIAASCPDFKRDAYVKIAAIYKNNQKYDQALEAYQNALNAKIGLSEFQNAQLQFDLADIYEIANKLDEATQAYLKIPYLYPKEISWSTKAYLRLGRIFEDKGDFENAKTVYQKIIDLGTDEMKFAQERLEWIKVNAQTQYKN